MFGADLQGAILLFFFFFLLCHSGRSNLLSYPHCFDFCIIQCVIPIQLVYMLSLMFKNKMKTKSDLRSQLPPLSYFVDTSSHASLGYWWWFHLLLSLSPPLSPGALLLSNTLRRDVDVEARARGAIGDGVFVMNLHLRCVVYKRGGSVEI